MANEPKRYGGKKRKKGGEKLAESVGPRKSRFGKAPAIVPALMRGRSGLVNYGLSKLTPWIKEQWFGRKSPSKKPSASTSRSPMKSGTQGRGRK